MFRGLSRRQLVVLGEPGSGKPVAALLLTLELLENPGRGEPVPILLAAASWDPTAEHFDTWAIRRFNEDVLWFLVASAGCAVLVHNDNQVARMWLALRAEVPWRLMTFLDDARQRGVLRANGPAYQFRHVRLQEHLAGTDRRFHRCES